MHLTDLPQDVLLSIYSYISPQDLLALNQTCRTLHVLGSSDYVWHQLKIDLPLETDQKTHTGEHRPFYEIRRSLINAFRVDANWGSKCTQIRQLTHIDHGGIVSHVQLLRDWMITLSRNQVTDTTYLSAWHLDRSDGAQCAAKVEVARRPNKFAAAVRDDGDSAVVALFNNHMASRGVEIFSLSLTDEYVFRDAFASPLRRIAEINYTDKLAQGHDYFNDRGMFAEVQANRNIVAVSVARIHKTAGPPVAFQIILVNVDTFGAVILKKTTTELEDATSSRFTFKLFPDHVAIMYSWGNEGSLYFQATRDALRLSPPTSAPVLRGARPMTFFIDRLPILDIGSSQLLHTYEYFGMCYDIYITAEILRTTQDTFGVVSRRGEKLWVFRLILTAAIAESLRPKVSLELMSSFALKPGTNVENLSLGRTGYRMVLLERLWETDEYKLKKIALPMTGKRDNVVVHELIPPHIALPFELHRCISIWFEEATGRICFGLHTGEVYLLEV